MTVHCRATSGVRLRDIFDLPKGLAHTITDAGALSTASIYLPARRNVRIFRRVFVTDRAMSFQRKRRFFSRMTLHAEPSNVQRLVVTRMMMRLNTRTAISARLLWKVAALTEIWLFE